MFFSFDLENQIYGYFYYHIRNQRIKIRGYREFQINQRQVLFGSLSQNCPSGCYCSLIRIFIQGYIRPLSVFFTTL